ncbi:uncharacterized protein LOC144350135 [Saccoglossus kowalevskii]
MKSASSDEDDMGCNESPFFIDKIRAELRDNSHCKHCKRQMSASITDEADADKDDSDEFAFFIENIGAEIDDTAFRSMKRLCRYKLPRKKIDSMKDPAELISALEEAAVLSESDLDYLSKILTTVKQTKLVKKLKEYSCTHANSRGKSSQCTSPKVSEIYLAVIPLYVLFRQCRKYALLRPHSMYSSASVGNIPCCDTILCTLPPVSEICLAVIPLYVLFRCVRKMPCCDPTLCTLPPVSEIYLAVIPLYVLFRQYRKYTLL